MITDAGAIHLHNVVMLLQYTQTHELYRTEGGAGEEMTSTERRAKEMERSRRVREGTGREGDRNHMMY